MTADIIAFPYDDGIGVCPACDEEGRRAGEPLCDACLLDDPDEHRPVDDYDDSRPLLALVPNPTTTEPGART